MTTPDCRLAWQAMRDAALERNAGLSDMIRVVVQWGHCSQAVGADEVHRRLAQLLQGRDDVAVVAAGCDGACFAATQVVVELPDGTARFFDRVADDGDFSQIVDATEGSSYERIRPSAELEEFFSTQHIALMEGIGSVDPVSLDEYVAGSGYMGLAEALSMSPEAVIALVLEAGLLGRGGAYFPAARKWQAARRVDAPRRHLVVNAEEGEPGVFKDRHLMEGNPHRIIEGAVIAAYAAGAGNVVIYINAEADLSADRMAAALALAEAAGLVGEDVLGSGFDCAVTMRRGAGGYVCGEETTLLNTVEGRRREPRLRPAVPNRRGALRRAHGHQQRGDPRQSTGDLAGRSAPVRVDWAQRSEGNSVGIVERSGAAARPGRGAHGHLGSAGNRSRRRWRARGAGRGIRRSGRAIQRPAPGRRAGRSPASRDASRQRRGNGSRGHHRLRRPGVADTGGRTLEPVQRRRVLRKVHTLPRGHSPDRGSIGTTGRR